MYSKTIKMPKVPSQPEQPIPDVDENNPEEVPAEGQQVNLGELGN